MGGLTLLAVAVALGTDAFSLALGMGLGGLKRRETLLFPLIVAIFHIFMPLTGMYLGHLLGEILGQMAGILGGAILVLIGGRTFYSCLRGSRTVVYSFAKAREIISNNTAQGQRSLQTLFGLATGVSLDALTVGLGLGTLGAQLLGAVLVMGAVAGTMTLIGLFLGRSLGGWLGQRAELLGGLILVLVGLKIMT